VTKVFTALLYAAISAKRARTPERLIIWVRVALAAIALLTPLGFRPSG